MNTIQEKSRIYEAYNSSIYSKIYFDENSGGFVVAHLQRSDNDFVENSMIAIKLAINGEMVELLPLLNKVFTKYPDAKINGIVADFKFPRISKNLHNAIQYHIQSANTQNAEIVVIYLDNPNLTRRDLVRGLTAATTENWNRSIKQIWLLYPDNKLIRVKRAEIRDKSYLSKI